MAGGLHLRLRTRLTSPVDEEMPTCIRDPLFALLPTDMDTEQDHLSLESLLGLPLSLSYNQASWILSKEESKLVCKLPLSEIKTRLKAREGKPRGASTSKRVRIAGNWVEYAS